MKLLRLTLGVCAATLAAKASDDFFDRVEQALTFSASDSRVRARLSGTFDVEGYDYQLPAPAFIDAKSDQLFVPRLTVFLDAQFGSRLYAFVQARADRGFDPSDNSAEVRLDEWALRYTPWRDGRINFQAGKFATVVGNWAARHGSWSNPFITAPLPYEHLTGVWDSEVIRSSGVLLQWAHIRPGLPASIAAVEKSLRVPIVWGPSYTSGFAVSGTLGQLRYAAEAKLGSLSSRPDAWSHGREDREHPTFSTRLGYRPNPMWNFGVSASTGPYLREFAERSVLVHHTRGDYRQQVLSSDMAFAWHHLQLWAEVYASRFEIPVVGDADTLAYYVEAKYKFTPRFFGALRWNQQLFDTIADRGTQTRWGRELWRVDLAPGFRFTPHTQLKFQYSLQNGDNGRREYTRLLATQFTLRF